MIYMTDHHSGYIVVLGSDLREDDAEYVINAIRMIKGVISVQQIISNPDTHVATERAKYELITKINMLLREGT